MCKRSHRLAGDVVFDASDDDEDDSALRPAWCNGRARESYFASCIPAPVRAPGRGRARITNLDGTLMTRREPTGSKPTSVGRRHEASQEWTWPHNSLGGSTRSGVPDAAFLPPLGLNEGRVTRPRPKIQ